MFSIYGILALLVIGDIFEGSEDVGENAAILLNLQIDPFLHKSIKFSKITLTRSVALDVYTVNVPWNSVVTRLP